MLTVSLKTSSRFFSRNKKANQKFFHLNLMHRLLRCRGFDSVDEEIHDFPDIS
jgi:hypothetical protein